MKRIASTLSVLGFLFAACGQESGDAYETINVQRDQLLAHSVDAPLAIDIGDPVNVVVEFRQLEELQALTFWRDSESIRGDRVITADWLTRNYPGEERLFRVRLTFMSDGSVEVTGAASADTEAGLCMPSDICPYLCCHNVW